MKIKSKEIGKDCNFPDPVLWVHCRYVQTLVVLLAKNTQRPETRSCEVFDNDKEANYSGIYKLTKFVYETRREVAQGWEEKLRA